MAGPIQKFRFRISNKIRRSCARVKLNRLVLYKLTRKNHELNYKLIKYIWWKNFHTEIKNDQLERGHLDLKSNHDINSETLFLKVALDLQNNEELKSKLDTLLSKIPAQTQKKYARESLKILYAYGALYYKCKDGSYQQDSVIDFVKQNLSIVLSQGKLEKTKIITQEQCEKLISRNKKVIGKLEKYNSSQQQKISLKARKIIFKEIKQYINKVHTNELISKNTQNMQQLQQVVGEVKGRLLKCIDNIIERGEPLRELEKRAENLKYAIIEFEDNARGVRLKTTMANKKVFYCILAVAAVTIVALACYIGTVLSSPSQSLDNVKLTQNMGSLISSIT